MLTSIQSYINANFSVKSKKEDIASACQREFGVAIVNDKYIAIDGVNYQFKKTGFSFALKAF